MSTGEAGHIQVFLRDCRVSLRVGVHAHEKEKPQPVIINVEIEAPLSRHFDDPAEDNLRDVINYETIYDFVYRELPRLGHIPLLETVAEQIIAFCLRDARVLAVRVRLEKPKVFTNTAGAGIEIRRMRHE